MKKAVGFFFLAFIFSFLTFSEIQGSYLAFIEYGYHAGLVGNEKWNVFTESEYQKFENDNSWRSDPLQYIFGAMPEDILEGQKIRIGMLKSYNKLNSQQLKEVNSHEKRLERKAEFYKAIKNNYSVELLNLIKNSNIGEKTDGLILASAISTPEIVSLFIKSGMKANVKDYLGQTPLGKTESAKIAKVLLENGADVNDITKNTKRLGIEFTELALQYGANPHSIRFSSMEEIQLLLKYGANPSELFKRTSPIQKEERKFLLTKGADINVRDEDGKTIIMKLTNWLGNVVPETISFFVENNGDINAVDNQNHSALYYAIGTGRSEFILALLNNKASVSINGDNGKMLADFAEKTNNLEIRKFLVNAESVSSSTELWNGFTDQMTKAQVIARANKLLNAEARDCSWELNDREFILLNGGAPRVFSDGNLNDFAVPDTLLGYFSKNKEFNSNSGRTVDFYFYKNKLYAVNVSWNLDLKDIVIQKAKENYGNNYTLKKDDSTYSSPSYAHYVSDIYCWDLPTKKVYLKVGKRDGWLQTLTLTVFSKPLIQQYKSDSKAKQEQERKQSEEQRRKLSNQIKF